MIRLTVNLNEIKKLKEFVNDTCGFESNVSAISGQYKVDSKSIMGLFSLNLAEPIDVELVSDDENEINKFVEVMKKYQ